ncbi:telomere length regulation protein-domain-containing protein [Irpex rosettiformis]|uniref:Telomere length regulation protein-domain-containing protein n=1 Tax=Irpex rosettiformis TaxID=378272 RepID=A0ACB8TU10_9APHY|nr:telomere length regulation protein-domain-containing protein [Irpex rosettiformis]
MSSEYLETTYSQIREVISRLQSPVQDLPTLLRLLAPPLAALNILPPRFLKYNTESLSQQNISRPRHLPPLQRALLEQVLPTWEHVLDQNDAFDIVLQYFSPDSFAFGNAVAKDIAFYAYSTILSSPITMHSVRLLTHLTRSYTIDVLWSTIISGKHTKSEKHAVTWEDCVRNICAVPAKVANALGPRGEIPQTLEYGTYFNNLSRRLWFLVSSLSTKSSQDELAALNFLLTKLVNIGVFPPTQPIGSSQPSFFNIILPSFRSQLEQSSPWPKVFGSISSITTLQAILISLLSHLSSIPDLDGSKEARALVKREAVLLHVLLGLLTEESDVVDGLTAAALGRQWSVGHARILVCYAASSDMTTGGTNGLELLLSKVVDIWTAPDHIRHSLLAGHRYFTAFLLFALSYLTASTRGSSTHPAITALSFSPPFITSIATYISHLDPSVRRCGMLVAEEVAKASGKKLDFGDWDGDSDGRKWCRDIRELVKERDVDADVSLVSEEDPKAPGNDTGFEGAKKAHVDTVPSSPEPKSHSTRKPKITVVSSGYDSDDSLTGYASEPSSSRSASPTPSELEEIEQDPTLRVGKIVIHRPVYLTQLGEMIRPSSGVRQEEEDKEPKKIEVALEAAEELIRRKRAYGTELEENAVNLAYGFLGLTNKYELEGFDERRQAALTALVACCPQKAAQSLIEEFFRHQYSTEQRFALLNALVFGARELAGLPSRSSTASDPKAVAFPSKQLPPAMHRKYITATDQNRSTIPARQLLEDITQRAIDRTRDTAEDKVPSIARERRLRLKQPAKISEVPHTSDLVRGLQSLQLQPKPIVAFTEVAAEHFICPLMNRFWLFLRDEQSRESRTLHQPAMHRYKAAGTGLILSALVLSQYVRTLAILVHMARNAPEFLAIIAPDSLELAITIGTRPLAGRVDSDDDGDEDTGTNIRQNDKEAAVLSSSLELAVVTIDGCLELDDGKSLGLEHTALVLAAGEWASHVLEHLGKGENVSGGGGIEEVKLKRAAAGLALKIDELSTRWRRSMVGL